MKSEHISLSLPPFVLSCGCVARTNTETRVLHWIYTRHLTLARNKIVWFERVALASVKILTWTESVKRTSGISSFCGISEKIAVFKDLQELQSLNETRLSLSYA